MRHRVNRIVPSAAVPAAALAFLALLPASAAAQTAYAPSTVTADQYAHAEQFLAPNTATLVFGASVRPTFVDANRFWYRNDTPMGSEFVLVDPARKSRKPAFDHAKLAAALSAAADTTYDAYHLPFRAFEYTDGGRSITFAVGNRQFTCDVQGAKCEAGPRPRMDRNEVVSPDGRKAAFIRDWNLWMRDVATGAETQLTSDGVENYGYATDNAGWTRSDRPIVLWSPDSRRIATFRQDQRNDGEMYVVSTEVGHPTLQAWKYPLPGDSVVSMIERVIIDVGGADGVPSMVKLKMAPDQHRSTICDDIACRGSTFSDVEWSPDALRLFFVSTSRDHKQETLREANAATGDVRDILEESVPTFYESGYNAVNWRVLPATNEVIWYSQRTNWGHLYLYDLRTGRLKHAITRGDWNVLQVRDIDPRSRTITFTGAGREPGDPYFQYLYRIRMDGQGLRLLTPDSANHDVTLSPSGNWFIDAASTPTTPPVTVVRDLVGKERMPLEKADISRLVAAGWQPPIPFTVKARDDSTDLYGLLYRPTNFDPSKKYPIVNHIYPGPQTGSVGSRSFRASHGDTQALAELGFVVVELDAMGTPMRSKSFHAAYYGDMGDNGLPDQVAAMKQLAARYPWIDLSRAGIYGHSGGGYATADAMFRYPDFFKVGIAEAGNHDNRDYEDDWGEKWQGLLVTNPDGTTNYDNQANQLVAKNLKGKLLLAYGTTDTNVPPYNTLLVVNALIAANKDFDLIPFPNRGHGFGNEPYMIRRRWDYFVEYLLGATPPHEYQITAYRTGGPRF